MSVSLNPYLSFNGNARDAMNFYESVFGGELTVGTFGEYQASQDPAEQDKVMHSVLTSPGGLTLMASDTLASMPARTPGNTFSISLSGSYDDDAVMRGYWQKLSDGGTVTMPLATAQWGDAFGMCVDRFGVTWLLNISAPAAA